MHDESMISAEIFLQVFYLDFDTRSLGKVPR